MPSGDAKKIEECDRRMEDARLIRMEAELGALKETTVETSRRHDEKLDRVTEAVSRMIALEATDAHLQQEVRNLREKVDKIDERLRTVTSSEASSASGMDMATRWLLALLAICGAVVVTLVIEGIGAA
jgi:Flp pilus assembly protein TadB